MGDDLASFLQTATREQKEVLSRLRELRIKESSIASSIAINEEVIEDSERRKVIGDCYNLRTIRKKIAYYIGLAEQYKMDFLDIIQTYRSQLQRANY